MSAAVVAAAARAANDSGEPAGGGELAVGVEISRQAYSCLAAWQAVSDEHRARLLLRALA